MRFLLLSLVLALAPLPAAAQHQPPDVAAQRAAMQQLAPLVGEWRGEATIAYPAPATAVHSERAYWALDGLLLIFNGVAEHDGAQVFSALGVISYDERRQMYEVRSYTEEGYVTTATGEFLDDGSFRWGFAPGGPVRMRFTIRFDETSWNEVGEMSYDGGETWSQTLSMSLTRTN